MHKLPHLHRNRLGVYYLGLTQDGRDKALVGDRLAAAIPLAESAAA